jgi:hypothetical protein
MYIIHISIKLQVVLNLPEDMLVIVILHIFLIVDTSVMVVTMVEVFALKDLEEELDTTVEDLDNLHQELVVQDILLIAYF